MTVLMKTGSGAFALFDIFRSVQTARFFVEEVFSLSLKRLKFQTMNSKECIERYAVLNVHFHREIASVTKLYHVIVGPSQKSSAFASVFARNNLTWPRSFPKMYKPFHFEIGKVLLHLLYFYQQIHFATCNLF